MASKIIKTALRLFAGVVVIVGLLAALMGALADTSHPETIYTVTAVQIGLRQHPGAWVGRTILVRGAIQTIDQYIAPPSDHTGVHGTNDHLRVLLVPTFVRSPWSDTDSGGPQLWADPHVPRHIFSKVLNRLNEAGIAIPFLPTRDRIVQIGRYGVYRLTLLPTHHCPAGACIGNADVRLDDVIN